MMNQEHGNGNGPAQSACNGLLWRPGSEPPECFPGQWSRDVVVMTNYGDVFLLTYFGTKEDGAWQRPALFNHGEKVEWWIDKPKA
jgi:hypothetical protein